MYGERMLIEKLETEIKELRYRLAKSQDTIKALLESQKLLQTEIGNLRQKYEPELEYARDLGRGGI
jgi:predicted  nucleic acid-binding Zn-ribbon protein